MREDDRLSFYRYKIKGSNSQGGGRAKVVVEASLIRHVIYSSLPSRVCDEFRLVLMADRRICTTNRLCTRVHTGALMRIICVRSIIDFCFA